MMASSSLESSEEKTYGFKLMRLIIDGGTEQLRKIFSNKCSGNLQTVLATNYLTLYHLFNTKKIITQSQWDKLYPHPPSIPNINEFDITLLVILLRNICSLSPPATGWNAIPSSTDNSLEADIVRIRLFRNNFFGHVPGTDITRLDFEARWAEVSSTLRRLGLYQSEINRLKAEECGGEEVDRVRKEWNESDKEVVLTLNRVGKKVESIEKLTKTIDESLKQIKSSTKDILSECLHQYDFKEEIQSLYQNYTEGTRQWVFDQVSEWLNDKLSNNHAFIISGQAGMGKSTIAALTCKRFPEHFGACHFFQYNNSRYNDPKFFLQSLAWQLCHAIPEYKQNLTIKLSGNKARTLDDQNIQGLFSMLFKEPFSSITQLNKHFLIVIDALDECRQEEKQELVDLITQHFNKFPRFIRFLITTRSETDISRKFQGLNPLFLQPDDERNLKDLSFFFENKLGKKFEEVPKGELVKILVEKSDGLMLYASFLCKLYANGPIVSKTEDLPEGIEEIYDRYFNRLEGDLRKLGVNENQFLKFLSVIAVTKRPLPLALLEKLFSTDKNLTIPGRTLRKLIDCLSSLLVIKDQTLLFFHKSVRDWLVKPNHNFTIIERNGHKALADICVFQMQTLKQNEVSLKFDCAIVYALQHGIQHILEAKIEDINFLTKLIDHVIDLEIVYASVCNDIYSTLNNFSSLESYNMTNSLVCEETQATIRTLISIIRRFTYILKKSPHSFLQHVVNENDDVLSSKASALLMARYKELAYFELKNEQEKTEYPLIGRTFTENNIWEIDISSSEDFLICGYEQGIELFSLPDFRSVWKIDDFSVEMIPCDRQFHLAAQFRGIVFHPFEKIIFPGQLTPVLNFEGNFEPGQMMLEEAIPNKFTTSCFSHDKSKMVTIYGIHLTIWNLCENKKTVNLLCTSALVSVLFSANDRFIAATSIDDLCVYDSQNCYSMVSRSCRAVLISTFYLDSWVFLNMNSYGALEIVKYDLTINKKRLSKAPNIYPGNAMAADEFQAVMESDNDSWFHKLKDGLVEFFVLRNESVLLYEKLKREIKLVGLTELNQHSNMESQENKFFRSFRHARCFSFQILGRYLIPKEPFSIVKLRFSRSVKYIYGTSRTFVPVANGVFVPGKIHADYIYSGIPELWNFEVRQRLARFPELTGTCDCVPVTQDLVACIMQSQTCFFNVLRKEIVARTPLPEHILDLHKSKKIKVIACSSLYDLLIGNAECTYLLRHENSVDLNLRVLNNITSAVKSEIIYACFSPNGQSLAFRLLSEWQTLYILDIASLNVRGKIYLYSAVEETKLEFVDEEHLLCAGYNDCLCLINAKTSDILTCINLNLNKRLWAVFACRNTLGIVVYSHEYEKFKLIKLWLPQQRENELPKCSCGIHSGNMSKLIECVESTVEVSEPIFPAESTENLSKPTKFPTRCGGQCSII